MLTGHAEPPPRTYAVISSKLLAWKYGSLCGWRFCEPQIPAYAMIVEPLPGSYAAEPTRLPPPQEPRLPLNVWFPPNWCPISCAT